MKAGILVFSSPDINEYTHRFPRCRENSATRTPGIGSPSTANIKGSTTASILSRAGSPYRVIRLEATVPVSTAPTSRIRAKGPSAVTMRRSNTPSSSRGRLKGAMSRG